MAYVKYKIHCEYLCILYIYIPVGWAHLQVDTTCTWHNYAKLQEHLRENDQHIREKWMKLILVDWGAPSPSPPRRIYTFKKGIPISIFHCYKAGEHPKMLQQSPNLRHRVAIAYLGCRVMSSLTPNINLAKLWYFTNLDLPEIRGCFFFP